MYTHSLTQHACVFFNINVIRSFTSQTNEHNPTIYTIRGKHYL